MLAREDALHDRAEVSITSARFGRMFGFSSRLVSLLLAAFVNAAVPAQAEPVSLDQPASVILLHGLGRTPKSMNPLAEYLTERGFRVYNFSYPSTSGTPDQLVALLREQIDTCCADSQKLHFVGHSLGGILVRATLARDPRANVGRLVMLGPPNHGSELVDKFGELALFRWALGPTAPQLGTASDSFPNRLPALSIEVGVIAGTDSVNPLGAFVLPDEDDGMVTVAGTKLEGMKDFLTVPSSHTFIMRSPEVARQVAHFLHTGSFDHEKPVGTSPLH